MISDDLTLFWTWSHYSAFFFSSIRISLKYFSGIFAFILTGTLERWQEMKQERGWWRAAELKLEALQLHGECLIWDQRRANKILSLWSDGGQSPFENWNKNSVWQVCKCRSDLLKTPTLCMTLMVPHAHKFGFVTSVSHTVWELWVLSYTHTGFCSKSAF